MVAPGGCVWLLWGVACMVVPGGMCGCSGWACVVAAGGMRGCSRWGACMVAPGGCVWLLLGGCMGYDKIRRYNQRAGGTHPTGMHVRLQEYIVVLILQLSILCYHEFRAKDLFTRIQF